MQPPATRPREDRNLAAIMTQRGRIRVLVDKYKVTGDKTWFEKQDRKRKRADRSPSDRQDASQGGSDDGEDEE
jgi:hypothetical protein